MKRDVANLVKEESAAVGLFELSHMVGMSIGESTLDMTEQFAFEQSLGDGSCIDTHHRAMLSAAHGMYLACQHILSRTVLACDEHSNIGRSNLLNTATYVHHRLTVTPVHVACHWLLLLLHGLGRSFVGRLQRRDEFLIVPRLDDEVECASLHALNCQCDIGIGSKEHDLNIRVHLLQLAGPIQSLVARVDVGVEVHVQQHHIRTEALHRVDQCIGRRNDLDLREVWGQKQFQSLANTLIIIDDKYLSFLHLHLVRRYKISYSFANKKIYSEKNLFLFVFQHLCRVCAQTHGIMISHNHHRECEHSHKTDDECHGRNACPISKLAHITL